MEQEYFAQDDESEYVRLSTAGLGDMITDEEVRMHSLNDFGMGNDLPR